MRKRVIAKKSAYIALSVGIAALIIFTALPYYLMSSICFPEWSIYWNYEVVQKNMMLLFPGLAFLGAVTTLKKRNTVEDVFLNVAFPMVLLLIAKVAQYHMAFTLGAMAGAAVYTIVEIAGSSWNGRRGKGDKFKKIRRRYYVSRRCMIYILFFAMTPMTVWVGFHENRDASKYLTYYSLWADSDEGADSEEDQQKLDIVDAKTWDNLSVESRFSEISKLTTYFMQDLGVSGVNIYAVKELTDGTLAYYSDEDQSISFNIIYLADCTLEEAAHTTAHECYHHYEHQVIQTLEILEEAGLNCENMALFEEAVALREANEHYYQDSLSYESYSANLLEKGSEEYAGKMVERLKSQGYLD